MRAACARCLAILVLWGASARAVAAPRSVDRPSRLLTRARAGSPGREALRDQVRPVEQAGRTMAPAVARALGARVLGARLERERLPVPSVIEQRPAWFDVPDARPRRPLRPRLLVYPMGFATGGGGMKLSVRF